MSYSFSVRAKSKLAALEAAAKEMDRIIESQPAHAKDRHLLANNLEAQVKLVRELEEGESYQVSGNGYMVWEGTGPEGLPLRVNTVSCGAALSIVRD